ncbi:MAG: hypothetical protein HY902_00615 [Deltaproteobacteria bacterium]|nr:hypothetical protein [Deltaproteobacteria bacterium]
MATDAVVDVKTDALADALPDTQPDTQPDAQPADNADVSKPEELPGDPLCKAVLPGHNNDGSDRINVVLLAGGVDDLGSPLDLRKTFAALIGGTSDNAYNFDPKLAPLYAVEGLAGLQPFASNLDRFNFWYVDQPLYGTGAVCPAIDLPPGATCTGLTLKLADGASLILSPEDVYSHSPLQKVCTLPSRHVFVLYAATDLMHEAAFGKPGNYALFGWYAQAVLVFGAQTSIDKIFVPFVHEFVHALGQVWDEKGNQLDPSDYPAPVAGPNCFSHGPAQPMDALSCAKDPENPWRDLVGNGCGADGVVDCPVTASYHDPNLDKDLITRADAWVYEVRDDLGGCGTGCMYVQGNIFRPRTACNVMSSCDDTGGIVTGIFTRLGPVNEREVCRRIELLTGSASGWCDSLCLAGCPVGQRCVQGVCKS